MRSVHLSPCEAYDVSGKCQNFLDSFLICESYFWTEVLVVSISILRDASSTRIFNPHRPAIGLEIWRDQHVVLPGSLCPRQANDRIQAH
jgi:hypothetical protein